VAAATCRGDATLSGRLVNLTLTELDQRRRDIDADGGFSNAVRSASAIRMLPMPQPRSRTRSCAVILAARECAARRVDQRAAPGKKTLAHADATETRLNHSP